MSETDALSDDELRHLWREAGNDFYLGGVSNSSDRFFSFLRSFAAHEAADQEAARLERDKILYHEGRTAGHIHGFSEGIEAAAHWHDEQAASHWRLAVHIRELLAVPDLADSDRREYLRCAQEQETESWRHEHHAKCIRARAGGQEPTP
jgi:hypothetical protein